MTARSKIDIELLERWWIEKSRKNFYAYRQYIRCGDFKHAWFIASLTAALQKFYHELKMGMRPILIISCPPQHGKSWAIEDVIAWIAGLDPNLRQVYASFSEDLGIRCNAAVQRVLGSEKYGKIFPETTINPKQAVTMASTYKKNSFLIEFVNKKGSLRNTTVEGQITGQSLDVGYIDDPFKGRKESNSKTTRDNVWNWFTDDFGTRFDDAAGYVITMTRWHTDDIVGRLVDKYKLNPERITSFVYSAIAEQDEQYRKMGDPLFPELKSLGFLMEKKITMLEQAWQSLYQGKPVLDGGNLIQDKWWDWWEVLPRMEYTYAVADTAQKKNNWNDFTVFQLWGMGVDGNIYLLDMFHDRVSAPELRIKAEIFYNAHNHSRYGGPFRGFCIEDKSSGVGLIQELELKGCKVYPIPRETDKITRAYDSGPEIRAKKVRLNASIPHVGEITKESSQFPNGPFDDAFDCTMNGIEVAFIHPEILTDTIFIS